MIGEPSEIDLAPALRKLEVRRVLRDHAQSDLRRSQGCKEHRGLRAEHPMADKRVHPIPDVVINGLDQRPAAIVEQEVLGVVLEAEALLKLFDLRDRRTISLI